MSNATPGYDASGDVTSDSINQYAYDAEGRICAIYNGSYVTGYIYDAEDNQVAGGSFHLLTITEPDCSTIEALSCDITQNGFQQRAAYVVAGDQVQIDRYLANHQ